ncbi:hypothetical protein RhiJN_00183 [Ceratobasidium sp. AG-Ba]|nr:hypothetical protein RhiJN_00183 [Ceratobasidium sp. AG-Ba]QRW01216.1 hypothetical protein RhiLY_00213 [Ceratobasidium sp. AG-Ba]
MVGPVRNNANGTRSTRPSTTAEQDALAVLGRRLTRTVDMWWSGGDVVATGKEMDAMTDDELLAEMRESAVGKKARAIILVDHINTWEPGFFERLNRAGPHTAAAARDAKTQLNDGQSNGRSEDARKVREVMPKWRSWSPPLGDRLSRGLGHPECAKFLAPPTLDFDNEEVANKFVNDGEPAMTPEVWGSYMWAEGKFDRQHPSVGMLDGELLHLAASAILFSPSSSIPETIQAAGGARGLTRRRGPIGLAKKYNMQEVNPAFIAYVACVTRHALTTPKNFSEVCDGFSYTKFYYLVRNVLESPKYQCWAKGLIARWNEKLFAGYEFGLNAVTPTDQPNAILNLLDAELEGLEMTGENMGLGSEGDPRVLRAAELVETTG